LEPGERIDGRYRIDRRLRIAAAGPTYLCQETDEAEESMGALVVIQVLSPEAVADKAYFERLKTEVNLLAELEHPNVVRLRALVPPESGPPYLVTDFESGGTLMDQLREQGTMSIAHVAQLGLQICEGLRAAHRHELLHGDLHPDRVLLDHVPEAGEPPLVRITDFGALKTQGSMAHGLDPEGCAPQYAAPERLEGHPPSTAADVYAIGSMLLFAVSLQPLVANAERMPVLDLLDRLKDKLPPRWAPPPSLGLDSSQVAFFNAVLNATMTADPADRCTLDEVHQYLEALLEVQDESVFEAPGVEETEPDNEVVVEIDEALSPEAAIQHFNAFSSDGEETQEEEQKKEAPAQDFASPQPKRPVPTAEGGEEEAPIAEEEAPPKPPHDWTKTLWRTGQVASGLVVLMMVIFVWIWNVKPHYLPPAWLEAQGSTPLDLVAGDHRNLPDYDSIVGSLNAKKGRLKKCGLVQDSISIYVVVEPNGRVRAGGSSYLPMAQRRCVRRKLLGMVLKRRSDVRPLRVRTTLLF
jgi:serine/threonine protein kinase